MQAVAVEAFNALRLRDYGRVDLRVTPAEEIYVIEVNPNCYLERSGEFARAAAEHGARPRVAGRPNRGAGAGALRALSGGRGGRNERSRRECAGFSVMRRRTDYLRREAFFAAFLRAPPFFAPAFFADDLRAAFFAALLLSCHGNLR